MPEDTDTGRPAAGGTRRRRPGGRLRHPYRVVVRRRGQTGRTLHGTLDAALRAIEEDLAPGRVARRGTERAFAREFTPQGQIAARAEIRGPGVRAGIDVRGDGSAEAFTGRLQRRVVEQQPGEDAFAALRRAVGA